MLVCLLLFFVFFFSSRRRHTRCALVTGVQTCALPILPYTDEMIENAARDAFGQATPDSDQASGVAERYGEEGTQIRAFDGVATRVTEMDALVAYLQVLGRLTAAAYQDTAAPEQPPKPID